ncbi:MAG TPA: purine-binding chemotaxis protein CheW, partial [Gammaproteobacteria bacterium]|nr:purine-binding chemotaxis protein CheW [Gammaproteobacteria bacterium]
MNTLPQDDRFITFTLNSEIYAIEVLKIQEVIYIPEITRVPGAPSFVVGVINLRGILLTIVDTSVEFGLMRDADTEYSRIVVVSLGSDERIGLLVDDVSEVVSLKMEDREPLPMLGGGRLSQY